MRVLSFAVGVLVGVLNATFAFADPSYPLAADDSSNGSGWRPPSSPTVDARSFAPVEPRDWLKPDTSPPAKGGAMGCMYMKKMPGMGSGT